eukprot:5120594-Amphidinium_carterae.1
MDKNAAETCEQTRTAAIAKCLWKTTPKMRWLWEVPSQEGWVSNKRILVRFQHRQAGPSWKEQAVKAAVGDAQPPQQSEWTSTVATHICQIHSEILKH